jgi:hypothetical protein
VSWALQAGLLVVFGLAGAALLYGIWWFVTRDARNRARGGSQRSPLADAVDGLVDRGCRMWVVLLVIAVGFMVLATLATCGR